jgi:hypothetical protein
MVAGGAVCSAGVAGPNSQEAIANFPIATHARRTRNSFVSLISNLFPDLDGGLEKIKGGEINSP